MKTRLKILKRTLGSFLLLALLNGCSTYVPLVYVSQTGVKPVTGAGAITVKVEMTDARGEGNRIGAVKDDWGIKVGTILTTNDVPAFLKNAIETELTNRGFKLGGSNVLVMIELNDFGSYFSVPSPIVSGGNVSGRVSMNVQVKRADASRILEKRVVGEYSASNVSYLGADELGPAWTLPCRMP